MHTLRHTMGEEGAHRGRLGGDKSEWLAEHPQRHGTHKHTHKRIGVVLDKENKTHTEE